MERVDVAIIGAGLIGSSIAWRLAQAGVKVVLLDRGTPGGEASSAAAGLLQPEAGREAGPQLLGLWLASLEEWPAYVREIQEVTSVPVELRRCGRLVVALDDDQVGALQTRARQQESAGIACELISGNQARQIEPALTPEARAALYFRQHALVDNQRLSPIVAIAASLAGVEVRSYQPVTAVLTAGGKVAGVATPAGPIAADIVVNAAGAWAGSLRPDGRADGASLTETYASQKPPLVRPAKGEIVALQTRPRPFESIISLVEGSVSARADGRIVVGGTEVDVGFDKDLTATGVGKMIALACAAVPALSGARFVEAWTGLRPRSPDDQPIIGEDRVQVYYWASGHYKTGILATPATATVVSNLILGRPNAIPVDTLGPGRFDR